MTIKTLLLCFIFLLQSSLFAVDSSLITTRPLNDHCHNCFKENVDLKRCGVCQQAHYCNRECQTYAWPFHKIWCKRKSALVENSFSQDNTFGEFTDHEVEQSALKLYAHVFKGTHGLCATIFSKDNFYDQLASTLPIASSLFHKALAQAVENANIDTTKAVNLLLPGIGYMSPHEVAAVRAVLPYVTIFGFDIDANAITNTVTANPSLEDTVVVADGMNASTWTKYHDTVDVVLFNHPLFTNILDDNSRTINDIGIKMLSNIREHLPKNVKLIMLNKAVKEKDVITSTMNKLGFTDILAIDNRAHAYPCFGFAASIAQNIKAQYSKEDDIVSTLESAPRALRTTLRTLAEHRYAFIVTATN